MQSLDNDGDGEISREEFASALQSNGSVMHAFAQAMSIPVRVVSCIGRTRLAAHAVLCSKHPHPTFLC